MDKMVHMLERYANQLESEVLERTNELAEEKKKTDMLLYRMLPQQVADALKSNTDVTPRSYESATIYFSDIVGFTQMASESTPLQVTSKFFLYKQTNWKYRAFFIYLNLCTIYKFI